MRSCATKAEPRAIAASSVARVVAGAVGLLGCPPSDKRAPLPAAAYTACTKFGEYCKYLQGEVATFVCKHGKPKAATR